MKHLSEVFEKYIGKFTKELKLDFVLNKSFHAEERQTRHGEDERNFISDEEILETVRQAGQKIISDIVEDHISINDRFIVRDGNTDLNIVCQLHKGREKDTLLVDIVTVIRTEKFWNKNNWVVVVR